MDKQNNQENEQMFRGGGTYYRDKIIEMVGQIEDVWILEQILKCIINITK